MPTKIWRPFATSHHSIVKNFLIGWKISYRVASLWFYFMFLFLSYLGPCDRDRKKSKCGDEPWKIPYLNKENSHSSHSSPWLFHPIWQTSPRRKKIGKQPMKTAPHPPPIETKKQVKRSFQQKWLPLYKQVICVCFSYMFKDKLWMILYFYHLSGNILKCPNRESAVRTKCPDCILA